MSNRSAISVAALFASILAGASLTSATDSRAQAAADNCLTAPKDKTPAGSHWYYRLERGTKRQCWYLRQENDKSARAALQDSSADDTPASAAADPAPPPPRPVVRKSIANAHAELTSAQPRVDQDPVAAPEPRTADIAPAPVFQNNPVASFPNTTTPSSTVATRWPDSSGVSSSNTFRTAAAEPQTAPPEDNPAATQPVPEPAPVALAAADSSMAKQSASMQMLFLVMAGALAIAGITASLLFRFGRRARRRRLEVRRDRRAIWDSVHTERSLHARRASPSMLPDEDAPAEDAPAWRRDAAQDPRAADDPQRRVTEMLSRLARSAQH
jgi:hypothetical protein